MSDQSSSGRKTSMESMTSQSSSASHIAPVKPFVGLDTKRQSDFRGDSASPISPKSVQYGDGASTTSPSLTSDSEQSVPSSSEIATPNTSTEGSPPMAMSPINFNPSSPPKDQTTPRAELAAPVWPLSTVKSISLAQKIQDRPTATGLDTPSSSNPQCHNESSDVPFPGRLILGQEEKAGPSRSVSSVLKREGSWRKKHAR
ncbi:hypothetical protein M231_02442 [Tremella mesenterica]|uniref:Uncharacterized protein n=1 Tax=Tremella mesenterica TaxID=5217 RepID=A0A4Q1BQW2_TREME|nr:hypothetical protein M231_02442 [Tremella mesenterica]